MRCSFDANVLIYSVDVDAGVRRAEASSLLVRAAGAECVLSVQVLGEFYHAATRKRRASHEVADDLVRRWCSVFPCCAASPSALLNALDAVRDHGLPYWDALLWAALDAAEVDVLFTEDFQDGRTLGHVTFVNPFLAKNQTTIELALKA